MSKFKSKAGEFRLEVNGFIMRRVKSELGLNLMDAAKDFTGLLNRFADDLDLFLGVLWICCEEQSISSDVSEVEFFKAIDGPALFSSQDAMIKAITDFFQNEQMTEAVDLFLQAKDRVIEKGQEKAAERMNVIRKELREELQSSSTLTSSDSRGSADAILTGEHSES